VLGPFPDATYLRGFAQLGQGDTLVLYTDGITECPHHRTGEEFGLPRLQTLIRRHAHLPAAEIVQTVFHAVASFAGSSTPVDDQTVVVVRRPAPVTATPSADGATPSPPPPPARRAPRKPR
jgi:sigma-B regulation protein RsbU (phosphoserine phosphatase)